MGIAPKFERIHHSTLGRCVCLPDDEMQDASHAVPVGGNSLWSGRRCLMTAVDVLPRNGRFLVPPVEPRHAPVMFFALLTLSSALASIALACATPFPGDEGASTAAIVMRLALLNVIWLFSLVVVCEIVPLLNPFGRGRTVST
jgi:hypothetical protein